MNNINDIINNNISSCKIKSILLPMFGGSIWANKIIICKTCENITDCYFINKNKNICINDFPCVKTHRRSLKMQFLNVNVKLTGGRNPLLHAR